MWRSAVQVCLGLHIAARQCASQAQDESLGLHIAARQCASQAQDESLGVHIAARQCASGFKAWDYEGGLAQLARALAWHARGHRFDPDILHP